MKACCKPKRSPVLNEDKNCRTRAVRHWPSGARVCYWRADVPIMVSLPMIRQGSTAILNKHKGAWLGPATDAHLNTYDLSVNSKVCHSTVTRVTWRKLERAQTLYRISSSRVVHTLFFEAHPIFQVDRSRDILRGKILVERQPQRWNDVKSYEARDETHR